MKRLFSVTALCLFASACARGPLHQDPMQAAMNDALRPASPALAGASTDGKEVCNSSNGGAVACLINVGMTAIEKAATRK